MKLLNYSILLLLILITVVGFYFRLQGISTNHSFWSDESYIASVSRDLYEGKMSIAELPSFPGAWYQMLHVLIMAALFFITGPTETVARIPSVVFGTLAIPLAFIVTKRFANSSGALISAFLMSFGQVMLVYSTQARPYATLSAILLGIIFCLQLLEDNNHKKKKATHIAAITLCVIASTLHLTGFLYSFIYLIYLFLSLKKQKLQIAVVTIVLGIILIYIAKLYLIPFEWMNNKVNNITYFRELFARQFLFIVLPAIFGSLITYKKYPTIILSLFTWIFAFIFAWNFIQYSHNVRYLIPFFAVLFVFFGVFWGTIAQQLFQKKELLICLGIIVLLYIGGYKIARKPAIYYNPNQDLIGDVQNADYKNLYNQLETKYPDIAHITIFNDVVDTQRWYLREKPNADAYFMRGISEPQIHPVNNVTMYGTLTDFKKLQEQYPKGILIVEDWHSFLPEDIKQYAKKNMKREIRVEGLPQANGDNWPLEVYSWGLDNNDKK